MLKCEGLTIRQLREFHKGEHDITLIETQNTIDEVVTEYLNSKPGTWTLINATSNQFGWYFIWKIPE